MPLICLPLAAADAAALLQQAAAARRRSPDLIEWRVDRFADLDSPVPVQQALPALREAIGGIPLIFTCRRGAEGGFRELPPELRLALVLAAVASGHIDLVDLETASGPSLMGRVRDAAREAGVPLILSHHNFQRTPGAGALVAKLREARDLGAAVAKLAVMPASPGDVLTLLNATYQARCAMPDLPLITMAMGAAGVVTRVAGGLFGSDVTFASHQVVSAPGQVPIADLRAAWKALNLYPDHSGGAS
jgi:3-dehydroquinate dehydratase-1